MGDPRRGKGSEIPWVGGRGAGGTGHLPPPSRGPERRRGPTGPTGDGPQPRCPRRPRTPTRRSRGGARSPGAALRGPAPLPHPGRLPGWQRDDVTRRGRRVATATRRRRYGDAATHAPAVAAGSTSRATMREGAPSPRQRGPHARPEARAGLEGQRGAKKSGGGTESPQGSPGELRERAGEGRAPLRSADGGWRLAAGLWAGRSAGSCSDTLGCGQNVGIRDGEDGGPDSALRAGLVGT